MMGSRVKEKRRKTHKSCGTVQAFSPKLASGRCPNFPAPGASRIPARSMTCSMLSFPLIPLLISIANTPPLKRAVQNSRAHSAATQARSQCPTLRKPPPAPTLRTPSLLFAVSMSCNQRLLLTSSWKESMTKQPSGTTRTLQEGSCSSSATAPADPSPSMHPLPRF